MIIRAFKSCYITLFIFLSGCTYSILQTADTVPPNKTVVQVGSACFLWGKGEPSFLPQVSLRKGLSERADIGGRLFLLGVAGDIKYMLIKKPLAFSLGSGAGISIPNPEALQLFEITAYMSKSVYQDTFYIAHRINWGHYENPFFDGSTESFRYPITAFGVKTKLSPSVYLMSEVNIIGYKERASYLSFGLNFYR